MKARSTLAVCLLASSMFGFGSVAEASLETRPTSIQTPAHAKDVALTLVFSNAVDLSATAIVVSDRNGGHIQTGNLRFATDQRNVEIPLKTALSPGVYSISWHAVSADGQQSVGGYDFVIDGAGKQTPIVAQNSDGSF